MDQDVSDVDSLPVDDKSAQEVAITETPKPTAYEPVQINNYDVKERKSTLDDTLKKESILEIVSC